MLSPNPQIADLGPADFLTPDFFFILQKITVSNYIGEEKVTSLVVFLEKDENILGLSPAKVMAVVGKYDSCY